MTVGIGMVGSGFMSLTYAFGISQLVPEASLVAIHGAPDCKINRVENPGHLCRRNAIAGTHPLNFGLRCNDESGAQSER